LATPSPKPARPGVGRRRTPFLFLWGIEAVRSALLCGAPRCGGLVESKPGCASSRIALFLRMDPCSEAAARSWRERRVLTSSKQFRTNPRLRRAERLASRASRRAGRLPRRRSFIDAGNGSPRGRFSRFFFSPSGIAAFLLLWGVSSSIATSRFGREVLDFFTASCHVARRSAGRF